jgi:ankyrin repeat protein
MEIVPYFRSLVGAESKQKLLFFPNADNSEEEHEISETALFRFLLNEETIQQLKENQVKLPEMLNALRGIDKLSKITEFETHQSSIDPRKDFIKAFHVFIVFKTTSKNDGDYWWSLEKNVDYIVLQRSRNKNDVKDKCYGEERKRVKPIKENLKGKGSIRNLFAILWVHQVITEKYHIKNSNCQSLVTLVSKQITEDKYEYEGIFEYSPPDNDRETEMLDLINLLTNAFVKHQHPLYSLIFYENTNLFDTIMKSGKYDICETITAKGLTPLYVAIMLSKTKMVQHLLDKWKADPTISGKKKINALYMTLKFAKENMDIVDLLLANEKVDIDERFEECGSTALHIAIAMDNSIAVKHLIYKGADPNIFDNFGRSPLHFAAYFGMGTEIMDLIVKAKNYKGIDDVDDDDKYGKTALHGAAEASNELTAEYLIKKGANPNYMANLDLTPLHVAAQFAKDMKIIDLFLKNIKKEDVDQYNKDDGILTCAKGNTNGLGVGIFSRLQKKGIVGIRKDLVLSADKSDITSTSNENTGDTFSNK